MRQTLLYLPHSLFEGWLLAIWLVVGIGVIAWNWKQHGWTKETIQTSIVVAVGALIAWKLLPMLEDRIPDPNDPSKEIANGLAIRGYGMMFLLGTVAGVGVTIFRAEKVGVSADRIMGLCMAMFVSGIAGARIFYVIQYRDQFIVDGQFQLGEVLNMTQGGLVVYGSLIGGLIAGLVYLRINKMPLLATGDLIAPGMALGLALGRIGCLLNGCCYGGVCEAPYAVQFPAGSPPYMMQYESGQLLGASVGPAAQDTDSDSRYVTEEGWYQVSSVESGSFAEEQGIQVGEWIQVSAIRSTFMMKAHSNEDYNKQWSLRIGNEDGMREQIFSMDELPKRSLPVHPTQIYSSVNAALLFFVFWFGYAFRRNDGELFAIMLILYPIARILLEWVRTDEMGRFGTALTISQWISLVMLPAGVALLIFVRKQSKGLALRPDLVAKEIR